MEKAVGGYFGLEIGEGQHFHQTALKLNTARNCLEYILRVKRYSKIYLPYYTCEVLLEPLNKLDVKYEFYSINEVLEPLFDKKLSDQDVLLYTNYFGLKQCVVKKLVQRYPNIIIDNAQAFFSSPVDGCDTFYSARKFFGVSDGAYLYMNKFLDMELEQDHSFGRMSHLLKRIDCGAEDGYAEFRNNDDSLINNPIRKMSVLTEGLLESIDYQFVRKKRRENYLYLHSCLKDRNKFHADITPDITPMVYPFYTESIDLRKKLIENKVYVATYWPNVFEWCSEETVEYKLARYLLPLPVDQRYGKGEMKYMAEIIMNNEK